MFYNFFEISTDAFTRFLFQSFHDTAQLTDGFLLSVTSRIGGEEDQITLG